MKPYRFSEEGRRKLARTFAAVGVAIMILGGLLVVLGSR
jgi:hypothetical protein